ncbi:hypothetical protein ASG66_01325 [Bacillus sp. Leaf406]|nr:hypothetical protein ASG66_01325 [Bacillus sp. Leaf406]
MKSLNDLTEIRLFFFGSEEQKAKVYVDWVIPYFMEIGVPFHAERDWFGGPNYRIVLEGDVNLEDVKSHFRSHCMREHGEIDEGEILRNLAAYQKNTAVVAGMERREHRDVSHLNHLEVEAGTIPESYVKKRFHSFLHLKVHTEALFKMQSFINHHLSQWRGMDQTAKISHTARFFRDVLPYSRFEEKYAVLVYVSNIEGVLAIAESMKKKQAYINTYERVYDVLNPRELFAGKDYEEAFGMDWRVTIGSIDSLITTNLEGLAGEEEGYYSHREQRELLYQNIREIGSGFHDELMARNIEGLLDHEEHARFKYLINVVYKFIHMIGVSFNEKNVACYIVSRFILEENGTTWDEILKERGESFVP